MLFVLIDSGLRLGESSKCGLGAFTVAFLRSEVLFSSCWRCCKPIKAGIEESFGIGLMKGDEGVDIELLECERDKEGRFGDESSPSVGW